MAGETFAIDAAAALLGAELDVVSPARIVVRRGQVIACGTPSSAPAPPRSDRAELRDALVVPGFIDAHVHLGFASPRAVLRRGVTIVRDLGWPLAEIRRLAAAASAGASPLVLFAGRMLTAPGGYPLRAAWAPAGTGRPVAGPDEAAGAVDEQVAAGSCIVKIALNPPAGPVLDDATLGAVVQAAHERGRRVTAHVHGLDQLRRAVAFGVDELAHMLMSAEPIPDDVLGAMVSSGMVVVPTLSVRFDDQEIAVENTRRFRAAGGRVVYGTDLGNAGPVPGIDPREVDALRRAGMGVRDVVRSATSGAAGWLGLGRKGAIAPGMDADLVAVPAGALEDHRALADVRHVWRAGRLVE